MGQLWAHQGITYNKNESLYKGYYTVTNLAKRNIFLRDMREAKYQTLEQRYKPGSNQYNTKVFEGNDQIANQLASFAITGPAEATLHE